MQKEIYKEDYFGNLMSMLVDQARKLTVEFKAKKVLTNTNENKVTDEKAS